MKGEKAAASQESFIFRLLLLVALLLVMHFLNLFLQWTVIRLELAQGPVFMSPEYTFLGFSLFNQKEIAAVRYFENSSQPPGYSAFLIFFIRQFLLFGISDEVAFIDLGPIVMAVPAGSSRVSFFPGSVSLFGS